MENRGSTIDEADAKMTGTHLILSVKHEKMTDDINDIININTYVFIIQYTVTYYMHNIPHIANLTFILAILMYRI